VLTGFVCCFPCAVTIERNVVGAVRSMPVILLRQCRRAAAGIGYSASDVRVGTGSRLRPRAAAASRSIR